MRILLPIFLGLCSVEGSMNVHNWEDRIEMLAMKVIDAKPDEDSHSERYYLPRHVLDALWYARREVRELIGSTVPVRRKFGEELKAPNPIGIMKDALKAFKSSKSITDKLYCLDKMGALAGMIRTPGADVYRITKEEWIIPFNSRQYWRTKLAELFKETSFEPVIRLGAREGEFKTEFLKGIIDLRDEAMRFELITHANIRDYVMQNGEYNISGDPRTSFRAMHRAMLDTKSMAGKIYLLDRMGALAKMIMGSGDGNGKYAVNAEGEFEFVE